MNKIPVHLQIIPYYIDKETKIFLKNQKRTHPNLIFFDIHGYNHKNNNPDNTPKNEFSQNLPITTLKEKLEFGIKTIQELDPNTKIDQIVFSPPYSNITPNTYETLSTFGIHHISQFYKNTSNHEIDSQFFKHINYHITLNSKTQISEIKKLLKKHKKIGLSIIPENTHNTSWLKDLIIKLKLENINFHSIHNQISQHPFHNYYTNYINQTKKEKPSHLRADIHIISGCNSKCMTCDNWKNQEIQEININKFKSTITEMKETGVTEIRFHGQEPTLSKDLYELISYAKNKHIHIGLKTNALLFTKEYIDTYEKELMKISKFYLSIDSPNEEIHNLLRGKNDSFQKNISLLKFCKNKNKTSLINSVVTKENYKYLIDMPEFAQKYKASMISFVLPNQKNKKEIKIALDNNQLKEFYFTIIPKIIQKCSDLDIQYDINPFFEKLINQDTKTAIQELRKPDQFQTEIEYYTKGLYGKHFYNQHGCYGPLDHLTLNFDGNIYPCCVVDRKRQYSVGNIKDDNFSNIWNNSQYTAIRQSIINTNGENCKHSDTCSSNFKNRKYLSRKIIQKKVKTQQLDTLTLQLTKKCNFNCRFCGQAISRLVKKQAFELSLNAIQKIVENSKDLKIKQIILTGGEPTIRDDLHNIIKLISNNKIKIHLLTNGYKLKDKEYATKLIKSGLKSVSFSIHSPIEKEHDKIAEQNGSFLAIKDAITNLKSQSNFYICGNYTLSSKNYKDSIKLLHFAINQKIDSVNFAMMIHSNNLIDSDLRMTKNEYEEFYLKIVPILLKLSKVHNIKINIEPLFPYLQQFDTKNKINKILEQPEAFKTEIENYTNQLFSNNLHNLVPCPITKTNLRILANGDVTICCDIENDKNTILGNIYKTNITQILNNSTAFTSIKHYPKSALCSICKRNFIS